MGRSGSFEDSQEAFQINLDVLDMKKSLRAREDLAMLSRSWGFMSDAI